MKKLLILFCFCIAVTFYVQADSWTPRASLPSAGRGWAFHFTIGTKGYMGGGRDASFNRRKDFWEYDAVLNVWTQKADFGGGLRETATGFSISNKGYAGLGYASGGLTKDLWEYDPATNAWTQKSDFGGGRRQAAVGLSTNSMGYVGTGWDSSNTDRNDLWQYDPLSDTWTQLASMLSARRGAVGFVIGNKAYVGMGSYQNNFVRNDLWEYDIPTNMWVQKANLPTGRAGAIGVSIGNKGYVGTGQTPFNGSLNDFWEYNPATNQWMQKADVPGFSRLAAVCFPIANKCYAGLGFEFDLSLYYTDFFEYTADSITGVNELDSYSMEFVVSPNPSCGMFTVQTNWTDMASIFITNLSGERIYTSETVSEKTKINLTDMPAGVYLITVADKNRQRAIKKIVKM